MSLGEEAAFEREIEQVLLYSYAESESKRGFWTTKDGRRIHVSEMTDRHISNCITMLKRGHSPFASLFIGMFEKEQERRKKNDGH